MISAIIVDDEQQCIDRLAGLLKEHFAQTIRVAAECKNVTQAVAAIKEHAPQLVFLDVQLHDQTGFDLLMQLPQINFEVIFTTAYEKYAVQAFKFSAIDYLLKPIEQGDLQQAINRLTEKVSLKDTSRKLDILFHNLKNIEGAAKRICLPVSTGFVFLQVAEIIRCESHINYTTFFLKDKKELVVAKTLKEFEEMLKEDNFYRVHNSHLINLAHIKSYRKGKDGFVTMSDGAKIEVSTRRKEEFLKKLLS
jgi:two-component system LytT family response regulator